MPLLQKNAAMVAGCSFVLGLGWILGSDALVNALAGGDAALVQKLQTMKGITFVILMAGALYVFAAWVFARERAQAEEIQRMEEMLQVSQRLEALGTLSATVVHDFNNVIAVMRGAADLAKLEHYDPAKMPRRFAAIEDAIAKAGAIVQQLSHFMRHAPAQRRPQDLGTVILGVEGLLRQAVGGRVHVTFRVPKGLRSAEIDTGQVEQILLNLAVNARDAMEQSTRRELVFCLAESTLLRYRSVFRAEPTTGTFLLLSVEDTGCGIPPEQQVRIFSPFFTTKPEGRGTGLGLASVLRLMQQHGGWVEVDSAPGRGACFRLYFPTCATAVVDTTQPNVALAG